MTTNPLKALRKIDPEYQPTEADLRNAAELRITAEYRQRLARADAPRLSVPERQRRIEDAQEWERGQRLAAGLKVTPWAAPLTRAELDSMPKDVESLGLKYGFLARDSSGRLVENPQYPDGDRGL